jgi:ketosteroid isomerase-like protein
MKTIRSFLLLILISFTLVFISCDKKDNPKESNQVKNDTSAVLSPEEALKEIGEQIQKAVLENDYETQLKFYAEDAVCVPSFQHALKGKREIRQAYMEQKKKGVKFHSFNANIDKIWKCDNEIYEYGTFGFAVSSRETKHPYAFTGSYFTIWEKQSDASYLIKYIISNYDFNPCGYY